MSVCGIERRWAKQQSIDFLFFFFCLFLTVDEIVVIRKILFVLKFLRQFRLLSLSLLVCFHAFAQKLVCWAGWCVRDVHEIYIYMCMITLNIYAISEKFHCYSREVFIDV